MNIIFASGETTVLFKDLKAGDVFKQPNEKDVFIFTDEDTYVDLADGVEYIIPDFDEQDEVVRLVAELVIK